MDTKSLKYKPTLWTLPREMYAEISRWLLDDDDDLSSIIRLLAGKVIVRDDKEGRTYGNGLLHSFDDNPAVIYPNGHKRWYQNGKIHRGNDLPAIVYADGEKCWYQHDKIHRDNGPARIYADGTQIWYFNDKIHRDYGPAIIYADGRLCFINMDVKSYL